jgi:hypothetical protein
MAVDELAIAVSGVANRLALDELSDPGSVPDELVGRVLSILVIESGPELEPR